MRNIVQKILTLVTTLGVAASANAQFSQTAQVGGNKIGSVTQNGPGSTTIVGGGNDIWDQTDEFTFNYQEIAGDFDVQVRVESLSPSARWSKAGIMARETLSEYSRQMSVLVNPLDVPTGNGGNGANATRINFRTGIQGAGLSGGQNETIDAANPIPAANMPNGWVRLVRTGSVLNASNSLDGVAWQFVGSQDTTTWLNGALPNSILVGLAVARHSGADTATAEFRNLQINYGSGAPFAVGGASSRGNPNGIRVDFNGPAGAGALVAANYSVLGAVVTGAAAGPTPNSVWLTTSALTEGTSYEVSVTGVSAVGGGALTTAGATFVHGAGYEARKVIVTHNHTDNNGYYRNSDAVRKGIGEPMVLGGDAFPGLQVNNLFEDPISDTGSHEQFSTRIAGVLNITVSGNYTFAMSSDDVGFMYLSTNDDPANKVQIANEPNWNGGRQYVAGGNQGSRGNPPANFALPINLTAGKKYYLEVVFTEGGGGNNGSATWQKPGGPAIAAGSLPIAETEFVSSRQLGGDVFYTLGNVQIVSQPVTTTVTEGQRATFSVRADGTPNYTYQWRKGGVPIPGANGKSYTTAATGPVDDNAAISVVVANEFSSATSANAILHVNFDLIPPTLVSAAQSGGFRTVALKFSEPMQALTAQNPANYSLGAGAPAVTGAALQGDGSRVLLTLGSNMAEDTDYTVTVTGVKDRSVTGFVVAPNPSTASFHTLLFVPGFLRTEIFQGIGGNNVVDLTSNAKYINGTPDIVRFKSTFNLNEFDEFESYGATMKGYFIPTVTGDHKFFFTSDDGGELWLSTDDNPANRVRIAREPVWNGRREFVSGSNQSSRGDPAANISALIPLVAGQRYYIEGFMKEGGGGDNMGAAVEYPGSAAVVNGTGEIPASNLGMLIQVGGQSVTISQQPASTTITENGFATFTVGATIVSPNAGSVTYQWRRNGVNIAGANSPSYTLGPVTVAGDNTASFDVVVAIPGRSATSAAAVLTVIVDTQAPTIVSALGGANFDTVTLGFSELVDLATANDGFNYSLDGGVTVNTALVAADGRTVTLTTTPQTENTIYTVTAANLTDLAGNALSPNTATFRSFVLGGGGVLYEKFTGLAGGNVIATLTGNANYPNNPAERSVLTSFNVGVGTGDNFGDNYGARLRAIFIPPTSGNYIFYTAADDSSVLFINPNGVSAAGAVKVMEELGCCSAFTAHQTAPIAMVAGHGYYMEFLFQEGGGGDFGRVAVRKQGDAAPVGNSEADAIPGSMLGYPAAPAGVAGLVSITTQPASLSVLENQTASISVVASNPNGVPQQYQWRANGAPIAGATGPTLTGLATPDLNGVSFDCVVSIIGDRVTSSAAVLTVVADTIAPTLVSAKGNESQDQVSVKFNELMDPATAGDSFNYAIAGITIDTATLQADGMTVILGLSTSSPLADNTVYTVAVNGVKDRSAAANEIAAGATVSFRSFAFAPGVLNFATYENIGTTAVSAMTSDPRYPNSPTRRFFLPSFDSRGALPSDSLENYGGRLTGFFIPPTTGNWIFYLRSDDASQLFLNPVGKSAAGKVLLTEEPGCCGAFAAHASPPQALTAGQAYYIEALYKEGGGGDYAQVAARLDTDTTTALAPISGAYLGANVDAAGVSVQITQQPVDTTYVINPLDAGANQPINLTVAATVAPTGTPLFYRWQKNGVDINGASGASLTLLPGLADNGAKYKVIVTAPGDQKTSVEVTLTVIQQNTAPRFACGPDQVIAEDAAAQTLAGWATGISVHSITRTPVTYASGFAAQPAGSRFFGSIPGRAAVADGVLKLTVAGDPGGLGGFAVGPFPLRTFESFDASWKSRVGGGQNGGADGYSFNVGTDLSDNFTGEEGTGTGLSVTIDTFDNGTGEDVGIDLKWGGVRVGYAPVPKDDDGTGVFLRKDTFVNASVTVDSTGMATVTYDGTIITAALPGYTGIRATQFNFGGRAGGANDNQFIDDLLINGFPFDASSAEAAQTLAFNVSNDNPSLFSAQPSIAPNGTLTYTAAPNANGTAHVTVVAKDNGGTAGGGHDTSAPCTFNIVIAPVNDCPVAAAQSVEARSGEGKAIVLTGGDIDGDVLTYATGTASHGTVSGTAPNVTYTSAANYVGPDSFTFTVSDGRCSSTATVSIRVIEANLPPTAKIIADQLVDFSPDFENPVLISCNWWNACIALDGTTSSDPEGAALTYLWFLEPDAVPFAAGPLATNCLELGTYTVILTVTDPKGLSNSEHKTFEVVTGPLAIEILIEKVNQSRITRKLKRELTATLRTALRQAGNENTRATANTLDAFEKKVRAIATSYPAEATSWIRWSQAVTDGMEKCLKQPRKPKGDDDGGKKDHTSKR